MCKMNNFHYLPVILENLNMFSLYLYIEQCPQLQNLLLKGTGEKKLTDLFQNSTSCVCCHLEDGAQAEMLWDWRLEENEWMMRSMNKFGRISGGQLGNDLL